MEQPSVPSLSPLPELPGYQLGNVITSRSDVDIYTAIRLRDKHPVTVKLCPLHDGDQRAKLQQEYGLLARSKSMRVLRPRNLIRGNNHLAMILDPFPPMHLDDFLDKRPLPLQVFLSLAIQLAEAFSEIHSERILHANLCPDSVFINPESLELKLGGFENAEFFTGEAKQEPTPNLIHHSLPFISPERTGRTGRRPDNRSDLYSLGTLLYLMLTGKPPFDTEDPLELIHLHLAVIPLPPNDLVQEIPSSVAKIICKLLEKDPALRYQTAKGLVTDLRHCQLLLANTAVIPSFELGHEDLSESLLFPENLFGRKEELVSLQEACTRIRGGRTELVLVSGPPGIGKTALVAELRDIEGASGLTFIAGKFDAFQRNVPYGAFIRAFSTWANLTLTGSEERVQSLRENIGGALGSLVGVVVDLVPNLEWILGKQDSPRRLGPAESQNRLHLAMLRLLSAIATVDNPMVMFLDNLHWADRASLRLLEALLGLGDRAALLIIGALRDDAAESNAPFQAMYLQWKEHTGRGFHLRLGPLHDKDVNRMIAVILDKSPQETRELSMLVGNITENNPLFIRHYLSLLQRQELITFHANRGWQWDVQTIRRAGSPRDVSGILEQKIETLEEPVRDTLLWAACVGQYFDPATIATISELAESSVSENLNALIAEGFLEPAGPHLQFAHDRIYEYAIDLTPPEERAKLQFKIGRLRLHESENQVSTHGLFDIVDNLNMGREMLGTDGERIHLVELNLDAAKKAMNTAAYGTAAHYLEAGRGLLNDADWLERRDLVYNLVIRETQVRFLLGEEERAKPLFDSLYVRDLTWRERAKLVARQIELHNLRAEWDAAIELGLAELAKTGLKLFRNPGKWYLRFRLAKVRFTLLGKTDQDLLDLPRAKDDRFLAQIRLLIEIVVPAYFGDTRLGTVLVLYMMEQTLKQGHHRFSPVVFAMFGTLMGLSIGETSDRERFGKLALQLNLHMGHPRFDQRTRFMVHYLLYAWVRPFDTVIEALRENVHDDLVLGDIQYAGFAYQNLIGLLFITGANLKSLRKEARESSVQIRQLGYLELVAISDRIERIAHFLGQNDLESLRGFDPADDAFDLIPLRKHPYQLLYHFCVPHVVCVYFLMEHYQSAYDLAISVEKSIPRVVSGGQQIPENTFYLAMSAAALLTGTTPSNRENLLQSLQDGIAKFNAWDRTGSCNYRHKRLLLEAELARVEDRHAQVALLYTQAKESASAEGFPNIAALIDERRASFALEREWMREAVFYLRDAITGYTDWGAMAKVCLLWDQYADYLDAAEPEESSLGARRRRESTSTQLSKDELDLGAIIQSALGISQEVERGKVSERVLSSAMAHAGAQRGVLVLPHQGRLCLVAEHHVHRDFTEQYPPIPVESSESLPRSAINFVQRTMETVILDDAAHKGLFKNDLYINNARARSILILPIVKRSRLIGMLYLENNLIDNAFSRDALPVLRVIAVQAASSLENARLYDELNELNRELERRVEVRTQELRQANRRLTNEIDYRRKAQRDLEKVQGQLLETARRAGMAEMATGVLHNVGNVLNSVTISATNIAEKLKNTKLERLGWLVDLLKENEAQLAEFITEDERGKLIPKFLDQLNQNLTKNHVALKDEIRNLSTHLTHAIHVIQIQQDHAKLKAMLEPIAPEDLVDQALKICSAKFGNKNIQLFSEFENLPPILIDRHKVLQILVNLIHNAVQTLEENDSGEPCITLGIRKMGRERMVFSVTDNGMGISRENITRIFSYGFTTRSKGHGFGLHNAANAATELGGCLRVKSEGLGKGACFTLELPFREEAARRPTQKA